MCLGTKDIFFILVVLFVGKAPVIEYHPQIKGFCSARQSHFEVKHDGSDYAYMLIGHQKVHLLVTAGQMIPST